MSAAKLRCISFWFKVSRTARDTDSYSGVTCWICDVKGFVLTKTVRCVMRAGGTTRTMSGGCDIRALCQPVTGPA